MNNQECLDKLNAILQTLEDEYGLDIRMEFTVKPHNIFVSRLTIVDSIVVDASAISLKSIKLRICEAHHRMIDLLERNLEKFNKNPIGE